MAAWYVLITARFHRRGALTLRLPGCHLSPVPPAQGSDVAAVCHQSHGGHPVRGGVCQAHRRLHGAVSEWSDRASESRYAVLEAWAKPSQHTWRTNRDVSRLSMRVPWCWTLPFSQGCQQGYTIVRLPFSQLSEMKHENRRKALIECVIFPSFALWWCHPCCNHGAQSSVWDQRLRKRWCFSRLVANLVSICIMLSLNRVKKRPPLQE